MPARDTEDLIAAIEGLLVNNRDPKLRAADVRGLLVDFAESVVNNLDLVGERGPEIVWPNSAGTVVPLAPAGGTGGTTVNIYNQSGGTVRQERRREPDGREVIDLHIEQSLARGKYDRAMKR